MSHRAKVTAYGVCLLLFPAYMKTGAQEVRMLDVNAQ